MLGGLVVYCFWVGVCLVKGEYFWKQWQKIFNLWPGWVRGQARTAGGAGNEWKNNSKSLNLASNKRLSRPKGDGSLDLRWFFRAGRRIVRVRFFGAFEPAKAQEKWAFSVLSLDGKYQRSMGWTKGLPALAKQRKSKQDPVMRHAKHVCNGHDSRVKFRWKPSFKHVALQTASLGRLSCKISLPFGDSSGRCSRSSQSLPAPPGRSYMCFCVKMLKC